MTDSARRRSPVHHSPSGWNTWDFRGANRVVYLDRGRQRLCIEYAIWDEDHRPVGEVKNRGGLHHALGWGDVTRLGPHAPLGLPAVLDFRAGGATWRAAAEERDGGLHLAVSPLDCDGAARGGAGLRVVFRLLAPDGEPLRVTSAARGVFAGFELQLDGATWPQAYFLNVAEPYALGSPGAAAAVRVAPVRPARGAGAARQRKGAASDCAGTVPAYEASMLRGTGALADAPEAMVRAVTWNTLFDPRRRLVSSPVSRDWCRDWKGVAVWCWDTFMIGALIACESPELARLNFDAVTAAIDELGMVPNYYMAHGAASRDRSMPCLGAYMIWKVQQPAPDRRWLARIYPRLKRWHAYWMAHRDGDRDGLLEWGSDAEPRFEFPQLLQDNPQLQHSPKCAMYESGLDNSPMYDDVPFNPASGTLELADVGLNSYYAMDCEALARIADCLGRKRDATLLRREYEVMRGNINQRLWDADAEIYCNRHWDGRLSPRWSPTSFFPLIAGVAPQDRAARMVERHLLEPTEFWGEWVIPSISRSDPAFPDNDYWRGRIWGPFNFLVAQGLRRYRFDDVAADLADRSLRLFMKNWREDGGVYENYNAVTGRGADVWNAARLYHWGGLMALVALEELIDSEPAGWLRFGSLRAPAAGAVNVRLGDDLYDVHVGDGCRVLRNGRPFLESRPRVIVRIPIHAGARPPVQVCAEAAGRLTMHAVDLARGGASVNGAAPLAPVFADGAAVFQW